VGEADASPTTWRLYSTARDASRKRQGSTGALPLSVSDDFHTRIRQLNCCM
jgi:hypothetical protein